VNSFSSAFLFWAAGYLQIRYMQNNKFREMNMKENDENNSAMFFAVIFNIIEWVGGIVIAYFLVKWIFL